MKCPDLDAVLEKSEATVDAYRYSAAWIDALARGPALGRSVLKVANEVAADELARRRRVRALVLPQRRQVRSPTLLPGLLNRSSAVAFNAAYYACQRDREQVLDYDRYFYPLDRIGRWNRRYGRRGFIRYQALFPLASARQALIEALQAIAASGLASLRGSLKRTGGAGEGMLSFPFAGYTLALDIPNRGETTLGLVRQLEQILLRHAGRIDLAADAVTQPEAFAAMYGTLERFRAAKRRSDSRSRFSSSLSRRLGITP
jgi:decaprenylphospho-beta-D-ribofuranose 2-oxidase